MSKESKYKEIEDKIRAMGLSLELITPDKVKMVTREFEESVVRAWRTCSPISPHMILDFLVTLKEEYASTVGRIIIHTPFWRSKKFADGINHHEFLHYSIYPVDVYRGIADLVKARDLLMKEKNITDPKKLEYPIQEIQVIQNILGDYFINLRIKDKYPSEWDVLWKFLAVGGKWEADKAGVDTAFSLYLGAYHLLDNDIPEVPLIEKESMAKARAITRLVKESRVGNITKAFAIKELVKIFHPYSKRDQERQAKDGDGNSKPMVCPHCQGTDFEVTKIR